MSESTNVSVGDIIIELSAPEILKIVSQTRPSLNAGSIECRKNGDPYISPGGTILNPIQVVGWLALAEVERGLLAWSNQESDPGYDLAVRCFLEEQRAAGPIAYTPSTLDTPYVNP